MSRLAEIDLAPGVHIALVAEDVVALDVQSDAYILIPGGSAVMELVRNGAGVRAGAAVLADLIGAGLALPSSGLVRRRLVPAARQTTLPLACTPLACLPPLIHALKATAAFRRRSLAGLVASAARVKIRPGAPDLAAAVREAGAYETIRPWVPYEGDCLQRSWMLHDRLCRKGIQADWVFGVRTWPFFAHCWVQVGDAVVGDTLNRIGGFTPIMAV